MLSLGTSTAKVEPVTFVNGSVSARAALRGFMRAAESCTCLVAERRSPACGCRFIAWKLRRRALRYPLPGFHDRFGTSGPRTLTKTQAGQSSYAARAHRARALQRRKRLRASILAIALTAAVSNTTENRCVRALEAFSQQQSQCIAQSSLRTAPPLLPHCACHCARQCACNERS